MLSQGFVPAAGIPGQVKHRQQKACFTIDQNTLVKIAGAEAGEIVSVFIGGVRIDQPELPVTYFYTQIGRLSLRKGDSGTKICGLVTSGSQYMIASGRRICFSGILRRKATLQPPLDGRFVIADRGADSDERR